MVFLLSNVEKSLDKLEIKVYTLVNSIGSFLGEGQGGAKELF